LQLAISFLDLEASSLIHYSARTSATATSDLLGSGLWLQLTLIKRQYKARFDTFNLNLDRINHASEAEQFYQFKNNGDVHIMWDQKWHRRYKAKFDHVDQNSDRVDHAIAPLQEQLPEVIIVCVRRTEDGKVKITDEF
jgi:hypothetical protein